MKTMLFAVIVVATLCAVTGCTNAPPVWRNLGDDATDVVNVGLADGTGVVACIGPFGAGIGTFDKDGRGLFPRSGKLHSGRAVVGLYPLLGWMSGRISDKHPLRGSPYFDATNKKLVQHDARFFLFQADEVKIRVGAGVGGRRGHGFGFGLLEQDWELPIDRNATVLGTPGARPAEVQVFVGLGIGLFLSVDPVELVDLVTSPLGWDLCGDDCH